jgi:hypothetical protein
VVALRLKPDRDPRYSEPLISNPVKTLFCTQRIDTGSDPFETEAERQVSARHQRKFMGRSPVGVSALAFSVVFIPSKPCVQ